MNPDESLQAQRDFLSLTEERELIARWKTGSDEEALAILLRYYKPFFLTLASGLTKDRALRPDLINNGVVAAIECLSSYEPRDETRFLSYARTFIRAAMVKAKRSGNFQIDIPRIRAIDASQVSLGTTTASSVVWGLSNGVNLSEPYEEVVAADDYCPHSILSRNETTSFFRTSLERAVSSLPDDEKKIMLHRMNNSEIAISDIADRVGIKRNRARMIEARAMLRMRGILLSQGVTGKAFQE